MEFGLFILWLVKINLKDPILAIADLKMQFLTIAFATIAELAIHF